MDITIWILQGLLAFFFMFSGINKAYFDEEILVQKGQTGVEGLPKSVIKFVGVAEIFGAIAVIAPMVIDKCAILTPIAAICLGFIMIPAAFIHNKRMESGNVIINISIFIICSLVAYYRMQYQLAAKRILDLDNETA